MSSHTGVFDDNPFADPQLISPFSDPSIQKATQQQPLPVSGTINTNNLIGEYNPFENGLNQPAASAVSSNMPKIPSATNASSEAPVSQQQSWLDASSKAKLTVDELQRRQEELDRRAAELEAREEALRSNNNGLHAGSSAAFNARAHNWPPLPSCCPIKPCFYQDIGVDIPLEFQSIVRAMYYLWLFYALLLLVNIFGAIGKLQMQRDVQAFGSAIVSFVLYVPLSFVGWFRPIYRAFRSDSSLNFMLFFLVFTCQLVVSILSTIGFADYGAIGVFTAIGAFAVSMWLGVFLALIAVCQGVFALACFIMLMRVHALYRGTTASFQQAQAEFASGILRNDTVRNAAVNVAADAARQAMQQSGSRY